MRRTSWAKVVSVALVACLGLAMPVARAAEASTLSGVVVDVDQRAPVRGATLWAADSGSGKLYPAPTDGKDGAFELALPPSTYELGVELDGGLFLASSPVELAPGQTRTVQVAIDPAHAVAQQTVQVDPPARFEAQTPTFWNNPLTAALTVVGAAIVVGVLIEEATDDEEEDSASPFDP